MQPGSKVPQAPRYDDDDVVEDYEVLDPAPSNSGNRRPQAAQGGAVLRKQSSQSGGRKPSTRVQPPQAEQPSDGDETAAEEPPAYDPNKGKISARASKQIWIICIVITVLGLGAVIVDVALDPFGRKIPAAQNGATNTKQNAPKVSNRPRNPIEERAEAYKRTVDMEVTRLMQKKAYKFYRAAYDKFRETRSDAYAKKAKEGSTADERNQAWADTFRDYYGVKYAQTLFVYSCQKDADSGFMPINMRDEEERLALAKSGPDILKEGNVRYQAAQTLVDNYSADIGDFWSMKKNLVEVGEVWANDKYKPVFAVNKDKFEKTSSAEPEFDPKDLEAIKE